MVIKFNPTGSRVLMLLGRKPKSIDVPQPPPPAPRNGELPGTGAPQDVFDHPADVAWDTDGNIFVADGIGNNTRIAKLCRRQRHNDRHPDECHRLLVRGQ